MKKVSLRKAIEIFGGVNIELHRNYCEQSGFFEKDGQLNVMYRTAQHRKDWHGGVNQWGFVNELNRKGYEVTNCSYKTNGC